MRRALVILFSALLASFAAAKEFNVKEFGAVGDGVALDSPSINKAIEAAANAGGGTVLLPPGKYLSGSIRLKSNIELHLQQGAVIVADKWNSTCYDPTEPFPHGAYQDGGHSFFHNSLIWGENLTNVSVTGEGLIDGSGLTTWQGKLSVLMGFDRNPPVPEKPMEPVYAANKAIALKLCKNVVIRGVSILRGGWFAILVTGCEGVQMEDLTIDTNRDGIDIDACSNVTVRKCKVNAPEDDAICPKSTCALGEPRVTENVHISECLVSGFKVGTLLDGSMQPDPRDRRNGRIKFGTESSGGFRNCTVTNCTFLDSMGFTLQEVDGGIIENIRVSGLRMKRVKNYVLYIVTGKRNRTPNLTTVSRMRNVSISDVVAEEVDLMSGIQIIGMAEQPIEGLQLKDIRIVSKGGGTDADAARTPKDLGKQYPDPWGKGNMPAYGIYARHVTGLALSSLEFSFRSPDQRPAAQFSNIEGLTINGFKAQLGPGVPMAVFADDVRNVAISNAPEMQAAQGRGKP